ncbi:hypothetical protein ACFSTA_16115 [Ornithinibacillus salinisoli]|uniref:Uncharacterized protein n=1 Tax=Ornithinibacillus salinisoli TaxID=1848459 RepID=A0ABW4W4H4_9BACI
MTNSLLRFDGAEINKERGSVMEEFALTGATWFWLLVPMPILILLSAVSLFTKRGN